MTALARPDGEILLLIPWRPREIAARPRRPVGRGPSSRQTRLLTSVAKAAVRLAELASNALYAGLKPISPVAKAAVRLAELAAELSRRARRLSGGCALPSSRSGGRTVRAVDRGGSAAASARLLPPPIRRRARTRGGLHAWRRGAARRGARLLGCLPGGVPDDLGRYVYPSHGRYPLELDRVVDLVDDEPPVLR